MSEEKPMANTLICLDLEGTVISNAVSQIPRPGLYAFLEALSRLGRIVLFTSVSPTRTRAIQDLLVSEGVVPSWFVDLDALHPAKTVKPISQAIRYAPDTDRILLIDDQPGCIAEGEDSWWVPVSEFLPPYSDDNELDRVARVARRRLSSITPTEEGLLEGLDEHTSHADELARPMADEFDPRPALERLKGSVIDYQRPTEPACGWDEWFDGEGVSTDFSVEKQGFLQKPKNRESDYKTYRYVPDGQNLQACKILDFDCGQRLPDREKGISETELIEALLRHINGRYDMYNPDRHNLVLQCVKGDGTVPAEFRETHSGSIQLEAFDEVERAYADMVKKWR